jgi:hypothetical protein
MSEIGTLKFNKMAGSKNPLKVNMIKGKVIPVQARRGPMGSSKIRFPDSKTTSTLKWKGVQPCAPPTFTTTPQEICLVLISVRG